MRYRIAAATVALVLWASPPGVQAQASHAAEYRRAIEDAVTQFEHAHWAEALAGFERAHALVPSARTLRGIGMAAFELRQYASAVEHLQHAMTDRRRPLPPAQREQVEDLLARAQAELAAQEPPAATADEGVVAETMPVQAPPALAAALPSDLAAAAVPGSAATVQPQTAQARVKLAPAPEPEAAGAPEAEPEAESGGLLWTWVAAGVTVAATGGALVLWLSGDKTVDDLGQSCKPNCSSHDLAPVRAADTWTNVLLGVAGVAGATTVVLWVMETPAGETLVAVGPTSVSLRGRF